MTDCFEHILDREGVAGLQTLLEHFPDTVNEVDWHGESPLTCVIRHSQMLDLAKWLLEKGADPNLDAMQKERYQRPIGVALDVLKPELLALLLHHGADPNAFCYEWKRKVPGCGVMIGGPQRPYVLSAKLHPLWYLLHRTYSENLNDAPARLRCLELLLSHGADTKVTTPRGSTLLHEITDLAVLELLLKHGADPNARNINGETPVVTAMQQGQEQKVAMLLKFGGA